MVTTDSIHMLEDKVKLIPQNGKMIYLVGPIKLPINLAGETKIFQWYSWMQSNVLMSSIEEMTQKLSSFNLAAMQQSSVLVYGDFKNADDALIRMHSICHTGDIFGSKRCDCGFQLRQSLKMITEHGTGALFYIANHEGRGIGLVGKALTYILQENGLDTVDANLSLGFEEDARNYDDTIEVLKALRSKPIKLITNNPRKFEVLQKAGLRISNRESLWGDFSEYNEKYLETKIKRSGHFKGEEIHEST
ncbi:GTP cyclohydrolase II [Bacillus cereus]|uniref:GTP cyclohydrolase II n=1 Tax=Bacillus cereus TaxID=1396 RepID=A0A9X6WZG9_BACCE|nr:GTP cyclohydrolase II [Bacillus cereus]PFK15853.1 GTP cyclohydrolase [Bacillus cereus]